MFFAAGKIDPGAFNLPLYMAFADPMNTPGLMLAPSMAKGFRFVIMDINFIEGDCVIELNAPEDIYDIAVLLRDAERYVLELVWARSNGDQAAVVSTLRLHNIAGKYTGFAHPFWDKVRRRSVEKSIDMRRQGFFGASMLPMSELEYTGITENWAGYRAGLL